jgi:hypothetical protein
MTYTIQPTFQADKSTDEESGRQPHSASWITFTDDRCTSPFAFGLRIGRWGKGYSSYAVPGEIWRFIESEEIHPPSIVQPIFSLAIPLDPHIVRPRCRRGYVNLNT